MGNICMLSRLAAMATSVPVAKKHKCSIEVGSIKDAGKLFGGQRE
jgi:hypothetical protein